METEEAPVRVTMYMAGGDRARTVGTLEVQEALHTGSWIQPEQELLRLCLTHSRTVCKKSRCHHQVLSKAWAHPLRD